MEKVSGVRVRGQASGGVVQGYLAHKNRQPPPDSHGVLGIGQLQGPRVVRFGMSKVPL